MRLRRGRPSTGTPSVVCSVPEAVSSYRYGNAEALARAAADERELTGLEREQFSGGYLDSEEEHQQDLREHRFYGLVELEGD